MERECAFEMAPSNIWYCFGVRRKAGAVPATLDKRHALPHAYRWATVVTLRWKLYRLAAKLVWHARG